MKDDPLFIPEFVTLPSSIIINKEKQIQNYTHLKILWIKSIQDKLSKYQSVLIKDLVSTNKWKNGNPI